MLVFIVTAGVMLSVALGFLLPPLLRRPRNGHAYSQTVAGDLVEIYRDHMSEVEIDLASGTLDGDRGQEAKLELEGRMLGELTQVPRVDVSRWQGSLKMSIGMLAGMPLAAGLLYWQFGNLEALLAPQQAVHANMQAHANSPDQIAIMVERLARKLVENPDNPDGWAMLARSLVVLGRYGEAAAAFEKADSILADAELLADYADAVAMTQNGRLAGRPMQLVRRALKRDPANSKASALAGTDAFDRKNYRRAALFWETALMSAPPDSEFSTSLHASLDEARSLGGMPAASSDTGSETSHAGADQVSGRISVSPDLMRKIPIAGTLFIYARAENGPRMPVAIVRKNVQELPDEFVLDDRASMSPALKISGFKSVIVTARISVSGDAMPASGDLIGSSGPVPVGTRNLRIEINETIR